MNERLISIAEVRTRIGMSRDWIYRQIAAGKFPKQRQLASNCVRWVESEIDEWIKTRPTANTAEKAA